MRLIDAEPIEIRYNTEALGRREMYEMVKTAPIIDAVSVVRCKDCRWWTKQEASCQGRCARLGIYPAGVWYCANGERKDDEID